MQIEQLILSTIWMLPRKIFIIPQTKKDILNLLSIWIIRNLNTLTLCIRKLTETMTLFLFEKEIVLINMNRDNTLLKRIIIWIQMKDIILHISPDLKEWVQLATIIITLKKIIQIHYILKEVNHPEGFLNTHLVIIIINKMNMVIHIMTDGVDIIYLIFSLINIHITHALKWSYDLLKLSLSSTLNVERYKLSASSSSLSEEILEW